ncbi:chloramphenicol acetyltransferase [Mucilaginibacter daejeonensis]|uniref:chloramphenicol acetyltransferase n=1 Tax=Mucilaginibacter daejeonensis TaxID=398049 RepID=UPI001D171278|nr:chloramphenicol acetyltransferase [Mucilaginibacter daejeonensis]UEG54577.1 chloramphenicol acetyltransferase [Mucilaginibacter daejeonensis]
MKHQLDLEKWPRKHHFNFFKQFEEPYFGVTVNVDLTLAYEHAKASGVSLFIYYLYQSLNAANLVEPFRYRIEDDGVMVYDVVNASPTINRPDGTFGFGYFSYSADFETFLEGAEKEIELVRSTTDLMPTAEGTAQNTIHYSALPWLNFTSMSHARMFSYRDSVPKISFGRITDVDGQKIMAVSIHVHHALMDGMHVGQYVQVYQDLLNMGL